MVDFLSLLMLERFKAFRKTVIYPFCCEYAKYYVGQPDRCGSYCGDTSDEF